MLPVRATPHQEMGRICVKKDKMADGSPRRLCVLLPPQWGRYLREGDRSFQVVWQTEMEVELERTTKKLRVVIAPISTPNDYLDTVVDDVVSLRWSKKNALPRGPLGKAST